MATESEKHSINENFDDVKKDIQQGLQNEPNILNLFNILDQKIAKCNKDALEQMINELD